jgi:hypothetical protein
VRGRTAAVLLVLVAGCGGAPPTAGPGPVATVAQYAAIVARYEGPLRVDAAALAACDPAAASAPCVARVRAAGARAGSLSTALAAANLSGSAGYVGAPPHEIAGLVADTRYDADRVAALAGPYRGTGWTALADLLLDLDGWLSHS